MNFAINMQDAKDYLDNLATAIKPYASDLQLKLQKKNLSDAQDNNRSLITEGNKLEEERKNIQVQLAKMKVIKRKGSCRKKNKERQVDMKISRPCQFEQ